MNAIVMSKSDLGEEGCQSTFLANIRKKFALTLFILIPGDTGTRIKRQTTMATTQRYKRMFNIDI